MKKVLLLLAIGLCLVAVAWAADFSGTWVLNADKTTAANPQGGGGGGRGMGGGRGGGGELVIAQADNKITITRGQTATEYVADGAEHTVSMGRGGDLKYKATLSGNELTVTGTQTGQRGETPYKMVYTLSDDGKQLTTAQTFNMQGTEMVRKSVYDKK